MNFRYPLFVVEIFTKNKGEQPMTGDELKIWQIEHGMSREDLAKLLGVHKATITNWRRGFTKVPPMAELAMQTYSKERGKSDA